MGEITLTIEEDMLDKLRAQAVRQGRSVEDEVLRMIAERMAAETVEERERRELRDRVLAALAEEAKRLKLSPSEAVRRAKAIASRSGPLTGIDLTQLIREDRDR